MGNVVSANVGQAPAKQAALKAGLPAHIPCTTINKVCASGTKAIMLAAQAIQLGQADVVVAGGMESMSNVPFYVPKARFGYRYGNAELVDGLAKDGLLDAYDQCAMGVFADATAEKYTIGRPEQDAYAVQSYRRAEAATQSGQFGAEIVPVGSCWPERQRNGERRRRVQKRVLRQNSVAETGLHPQRHRHGSQRIDHQRRGVGRGGDEPPESRRAGPETPRPDW